MKINPSEVKRIGIFRALQIGDMLCSIPAVRALKSAYPDAEITLIGLPWSATLIDRLPQYLDAFIHFPGYPGLPEQKFDPREFPGFLEKMLNARFDLVLQMQGNGSIVNPMIELFGAKYTAGFSKNGHYFPDNGLFREYPESGHEVERLLALIKHLDIPEQGTHLEFPVTSLDYENLANEKLPVSPGNYVCLHPGARGKNRRWPAENYAVLADLVAEKGLQPVITGTNEELDIIENVVKRMKSKAVIMAGKTNLGTAAALINNSYGLISNCTGVSHLASALRKKSIVISMANEIERWAPINKEVHKVINWAENPSLEAAFGETEKWLRE